MEQNNSAAAMAVVQLLLSQTLLNECGIGRKRQKLNLIREEISYWA
ncbi:hypothetical protein HYX14_02205 [Candidatus Woesearchaeota archaeon]|nr:hypothetical protein [Candidatus Woesearchaeota archaeon]